MKRSIIFVFLLFFLILAPVTAEKEPLGINLEFPAFYEINISGKPAKNIGVAGVEYPLTFYVDFADKKVNLTNRYLEVSFIYEGSSLSNESIFVFDEYFVENDMLNVTFSLSEELWNGECSSFHNKITFVEPGSYWIQWREIIGKNETPWGAMRISIVEPYEYENLQKQAQLIDAERDIADETSALTKVTFGLVIAAFITLLYSVRRLIKISTKYDYKLPELSQHDFEDDVFISLPLEVEITLYNEGNESSIVKDLNLKFEPHPDFKKLFREVGEWYDIKSGKKIELGSPVFIQAKEKKILTFKSFINLAWDIRMRQSLVTLNIKESNMNVLLDEMLSYKKGLLKGLIEYLKREHKKLGELIVSYGCTKKYSFLPIKFDQHKDIVEINHSYEDTTRYYEEWLNKYQLSESKREIIQRTLRRLIRLKKYFESYNSFISENLEGEDYTALLNIPRSTIDHFQKIVDKKNEEIELLSKCRYYTITIEDHVKPLLKKLVEFYRKADKADEIPTEELRKEEIIKLKEQQDDKLKREIEEILPELESLISNLENEFRVIDWR